VQRSNDGPKYAAPRTAATRHRSCPASSLPWPCPAPRRVRPRFPGRRSCQLHPPVSPLLHCALAWLRCRAHYPGGADRHPCRLLPGPCGLARISGGPASAISLSRPAQPYCALRAASLLVRLSPGLCHEASAWPVTRRSRSSASILADNYIGGLLPPTGCPRRKGARRNAG